MRDEQGQQRRDPRSAESHSGGFGLGPAGRRESWKDFKWRHTVIRFVPGDDPAASSSENGGKESQWETGSPIKITLQ